MNIKEIAIQCGHYVSDYDGKDYKFTLTELSQFTQAIIHAYVAEQKPVAWYWDYDGVSQFTQDIAYVEYLSKHVTATPLFTL